MKGLLLIVSTLLLFSSCSILNHHKITQTHHGYDKWGNHWMVWVTPNVVKGDSVVIWAHGSSADEGKKSLKNVIHLNHQIFNADTNVVFEGDVFVKTVPDKYVISLTSLTYTYTVDTKKIKLQAGDSLTLVTQFIHSYQSTHLLGADEPKFTRKERRMYKRYKKQQEKNE